MNRNWIFIILAGFIEVLWVLGLKHSSSIFSWAATFFLIYLSFVMVIKATKVIPVATAYAVFTGMGTAGTVLVDMLVFGEPFSYIKLAFILLLLMGVLGLKLVSSESNKEEGVR